jgi:hypothetical protein
MTQEQLEAIKNRLQAALPKADGASDRLQMTWTKETVESPAKVWYDDGDLCAKVYGNLGLGIDDDAIAEFFANAMSDMGTLLDEIAKLKN